MTQAHYRRLTTILFFLSLSSLLWHSAQAVTGPPRSPNVTGDFRMQDVTRGSLLARTQTPGRYRDMPALHTDVRMRVFGMINQVTLKQRFRNDSLDWLEAVYVFPLPDDSAVYRLRMHIGDRVIVGEIQERNRAKRNYTKAKRAGKKTSLIEQERANIFTTSVANIGPGESIVIEITYEENLKYDNKLFRIRFPLVVGPRYIPGTPIRENIHTQQSGKGWALDTDQVPDASRISPPVLRPEAGKINPVTLEVELDTGLPLAEISSSYHDAEIIYEKDQIVRVRLKGEVYADRDFELSWRPKLGQTPRAAVFREQKNGDDHLLFMLMPPREQFSETARLTRELILVIDTSGSMHGLSIQQARDALLYALDQLKPQDYFNLIQFNSRTRLLFPTAQAADSYHLAQARDYVSALRAGGGTEMASALRAALRDRSENGRVRQVIFLTDGSVGNETRLFNIIQDQLGRSRLFTVGIGSAPNGFFMTRAAGFGRGSYTYIGDITEVRKHMEALFAKLTHPVLTDVSIDWHGVQTIDVQPTKIPDLYRGEPLLVSARLSHPATEVTVRGRIGDTPWQVRLDLRGQHDQTGVARLWARKKIRSLMEENTRRNEPTIIQQVLDLGLKHELITRYTSLVAIDKTPSRPAASDLKNKAMPTNLPHGWNYKKVFGRYPQTATGIALHLWLGILLLLLTALVWWWSAWTGTAKTV